MKLSASQTMKRKKFPLTLDLMTFMTRKTVVTKVVICGGRKMLVDVVMNL